jgi:hypothetical protein
MLPTVPEFQKAAMDTNPYVSPETYQAEALSAAAANFRDQIVGLKVYGVLQIVMGGLCGVGAVGTAAVAFSTMAGQQAGALNWQVLPGVLYCVALAVGLVWLGIGSFFARRWAWALNLIFSWLTLAVGTVTSLLMGVMLPAMFRGMFRGNPQSANVPPEALVVIMVVTGGVMLVFYIGVPLAFVLFYRRPAVRATCEWYDPKPRWTERRPLPVLGLSIILGYGFLTAPSLAANGCTVPCFGHWASGLLGGLILLGMVLVLGYLVWGTYRQQQPAWWGTMFLLLIVGASYVLTFLFADPMEMYAKMNLPAEQLAMMQRMGMNNGLKQGGLMVVYLAMALGYLFYVRRYYVGEKKAA